MASTVASLLRLAAAKRYRILFETESLALSSARHAVERFSGYGNLTGRIEADLDVVFVMPPVEGWSCVLGLEDLSSPKLMYASELASLSGCDALECGFDNSICWWYVLYQQGDVIDRFDSNPHKGYLDRAFRAKDLKLYPEPFDPNDPREIYYQSTSNTEFPVELLSVYRGDAEKVVALLNARGQRDSIQTTLDGRMLHPEAAFLRFCNALSFPDSHHLSAADLFDELVWFMMRAEDAGKPENGHNPRLLEWIEAGLGMIVLQH